MRLLDMGSASSLGEEYMAAMRYAFLPIVAALTVLATQARTLNFFGCAQARTAAAGRMAAQASQRLGPAALTAAKERQAAAAAVAAAAVRPATSHPPPRFALLELSVIDPNRDPAGTATTPFAANSREPIRVETDYFSGHALLLLRPEKPGDDPRYAAHFEASGPRVMEMQVQGRFKQLPRGVLYLGGEVLEPTKLGVVTKGLANVLLKFLTLWANSRRLSLHCCLDDKGGGQLAHVTMPLWCAADRIVATPAGCAPPQLGTELPEADEAVLARRASCETGTWQLGSTYSFSFHNAHFDMPTWRTVNLPARQLDLHAFWSAMRLVLYDADPTAAEHLREQVRYLACVQAHHLGGEEVAAAEQRLLSGQQLPSETRAKADVAAEADVPEQDEDADALASASGGRAGAVRLQRPPPRPSVHGAGSWWRVFRCFVPDDEVAVSVSSTGTR